MATLHTYNQPIPPAEIKRIVLIVSPSAEDDPRRPPLEESLSYRLLDCITTQQPPGENYACWRIYTAQSAQTAKALENCFGGKFHFDNLGPIADIDDEQGVFTRVKKIAAERINEGQTIFCDLTGGTKTISIALVVSCIYHALTADTSVKLRPTFVRPKDMDEKIHFYPFDVAGVIAEFYIGQQRRIGQLQHLTRLARTLAHEIKNPLSLITYDLFSVEKEPLSARAKELVHEMKGTVREITKIIDSIQQAAREETNTYHQTPIHLNEVMGHVQARTHKRFPNLRLILEGDYAGVHIRMPEEKLYSIFTNLIDNAAHASKGQGEVRIRFTCADNSLSVTIEDDGPGIPSEQIEDLFKPLRRGKNSSGTGMGLAIVKAFITEEGGTIAYDPSYKAGARFLLEIPISIANKSTHD